MADETKVDIWMPLYVRDFLASTIGWTAEEKGHYLMLLMVQWDRGGLPADADALNRLSPGIASVWHLLGGKFVQGADGLLRNEKLEEHRERSLRLKETRQQSGKRAAECRWNASGNASRNASRNASGNASRNADAMRETCPPPSPSPSPSPSPISSSSHAASSPDGEDLQQAAPVVATSDPPKRRKRSQPPDAISWNPEGGWRGITDENRKAWAAAYPACVLDIELIRASEWLLANPAKAHKSNWRRFLVSWLTRSQDRGGTERSAGRTPEHVANQRRLESKAREFAGYRPAPYRRPHEVAALADSLKLKEDDLQ